MIIVIFQFVSFLMCMEFPRWLSGKESTCQCRKRGFDPWSRKIPWRRKWQPTPVFWPENPQGQRILAGYSPWGRKKVRHDLATTKSIAWDSYGLIKNLFCSTATATAKSLQSCLTLCDPIDGSPPGSSIPGILQARTLVWVAISFSNAWKWKVKGKSLSRVRLLATPWTAAYQAPPSMGFSRQEYWSGVPLPCPLLLKYILNLS